MYEIIDVFGVEQHVAKHVYEVVESVVNDVTGWNVDMMQTLQGPDNTGITLDMSEDIDNLIRDGRFPFTLQRHLEGYFGDSTGSSNVTSVRLEEQMNIREVIELLAKTGQLEDALGIIEDFRQDDDPKAEIILTYALAQYAKGWLAEEYVTQQEWADTEGLEGANKGSVSQDEGGIDFYYQGDETQLGSITRYNSKKKEMEASDIRHLLYQWDDKGNIHVADMDEILSVNKKIAKEAGKSATLTRRSYGKDLKAVRQVGRSFRYLWW